MVFLVFFISFIGMEFVAWFTHKYIMHGIMWYFHKDHHVKENHKSFFERNDVFFLIFATPGAGFIMLGPAIGMPLLVPVGYGIAAYGLAYFLVHDVFIHQRFKWLRNADNTYFRAIRRAHKMHHKHITKEDGECFGMLLVPLKYFRENRSKAAV